MYCSASKPVSVDGEPHPRLSSDRVTSRQRRLSSEIGRSNRPTPPRADTPHTAITRQGAHVPWRDHFRHRELVSNLEPVLLVCNPVAVRRVSPCFVRSRVGSRDSAQAVAALPAKRGSIPV